MQSRERHARRRPREFRRQCRRGRAERRWIILVAPPLHDVIVLAAHDRRAVEIVRARQRANVRRMQRRVMRREFDDHAPSRHLHVERVLRVDRAPIRRGRLRQDFSQRQRRLRIALGRSGRRASHKQRPTAPVKSRSSAWGPPEYPVRDLAQRHRAWQSPFDRSGLVRARSLGVSEPMSETPTAKPPAAEPTSC